MDFVRKKTKKLQKVVLTVAFAALLMVTVVALITLHAEGVKSVEAPVSGQNDTPAVFKVQPNRRTLDYTSPVFDVEFEFNALATSWEEELFDEQNSMVEVRVSDDAQDWTQWMEVEVGRSMRDGDENERVFMETPLFIEGRHLQYKVSLSRSSVDEPAPQIRDIRMNYIDSRQSDVSKVANNIASFFRQAVHAENQEVNVVSRKDWGNPDPYGSKFKSKDNYWAPYTDPVEQVFLHHTVTANEQSDPEAVMRGIWDYHANTLGWGDIGYNYVLDSNGTVYEGRFGGDNVIAGHVRSYNTGSFGVAVLGCFQPDDATCDELNDGNTEAPSNTVINSLTSLLSWKTTNFEIDPQATHQFCNYKGEDCLSLSTIAAHRDAGNTSCNGDLFYDQLSTIREDVATKNSDDWVNSVKQTDFTSIDLSQDRKVTKTFSFKNTGTSTWSNDTNLLQLKTANPDDRISTFKDSSWLDDSTLATLNEASVVPGGTGTFDVTFKRPSDAFGNYFEGIRLVHQDDAKFNNFHTFHVKVFCTYGTETNLRPNGTLIRNPNNGKIFWLEGGEKRHVISPAAAKTNRLVLGRSVNVSSSELSLYTTGVQVNIDEGTVVKAKGSTKIYIIDRDGDSYVKRHVANPATMKLFDLWNAEVYELSSNKIKAFGNGLRLDQDSPIPDGLLIKGDKPEIYVVEDGQKRWINHGSVLKSYGYSGSDVRRIEQAKIDKTPKGATLGTYRPGTVFTSDDTVKIFAADIDADSNNIKRWVVTPRSLTEARFRWKDIISAPSYMLDRHASAETIYCHK